MSKRSQEKRITAGSRTLKFLRNQTGVSLRAVQTITGMSDTLVAHLENGRLDISERHLEKLLPAYGVPRSTYDLFTVGNVKLPQNLREECLELIRAMTLDQLRTAHPVLASLSSHK